MSSTGTDTDTVVEVMSSPPSGTSDVSDEELEVVVVVVVSGKVKIGESVVE